MTILKSALLSASIAVTLSSPGIAGQIPRQWHTHSADVNALPRVAATTDSVPGSNNIVDFVADLPDAWAATAKGPSRRTLPDPEWTTYNKDDGLPSLEIPAIGAFPNGVWSATSHIELRDGRVVTWGDGLFHFNDGTETWEDRSPAGNQTSGPFQLAYDLAYFRGNTLAACFAGGLVVSSDDGATWNNIFFDGTAKSDFDNQVYNDLNNRYFAIVVDSTRPESLAVWAGTAYGILRYVYLSDSLKPKGHVFNDLHVDGISLLAATDDGLSRTPDRGGTWRSFYSNTEGFPSDNVISTAANGDTMWAGFAAGDGTSGLGLAYSYDAGATWTITQPSEAMGVGHRPLEITLTRGKVWVACEDEGVIHSNMPLIEWESAIGIPTYSLVAVPPDTAETVYMGTTAGVYLWPVAGPPLPGAAVPVGTPADNIGQRVIGLGYQPNCSTSAPVVWALCEDNGAGGTPGFATTTDGGDTWDVSSRRLGVRDVIFEGCRFWLASDSGLAEGNLSNLDSLMFMASYAARVNNNLIGSRPLSLAAELGKDAANHDVLVTLWVGTDSLLTYTLDKGLTWATAFSNPDPVEYDLRYRYNYVDVDTANTGFEQLSGNFITALGFQPGGRGAIWAATQATGQGRFANVFVSTKEKDGISVTRDAGRTWSVPLTGHQVWNFAFDGAIVWAASSQGLLYSPNSGVTWDTINYFVDPESGAVIDSTAEVYAVEIVGDEVWVGTANGMAVLDRNANLISVRRTFSPVTSSTPGGEGGAYATPVPFSPNISPGAIHFHYIPPADGPVTIKIYDYANRLVKTVTDGAQRDGGRQYDETDIWDGRNGKGDVVAVGTYFFVIEYSGGETHWGKLVVIP